MNELQWLKKLHPENNLNAENVSVAQAVVRNIRLMRAEEIDARRKNSINLKIWATVAGFGTATSFGIGLLAMNLWQTVFSPGAELFTFWDVVMR